MGRSRIVPLALGGAFTAAILLFAILQTAIGQRSLAVIVSASVSTKDSRFEFTGLRGSFPTDLTVGCIEISDRQGAWLRIENAHVEWSLAALFHGRLQIDTISANALPRSGRRGRRTS